MFSLNMQMSHYLMNNLQMCIEPSSEHWTEQGVEFVKFLCFTEGFVSPHESKNTVHSHNKLFFAAFLRIKCCINQLIKYI